MGSTGVASPMNTGSSASYNGKSVTELNKYANWQTGPDELRKDFNLDFASDNQIRGIRGIINGVLQYDKDYNDKPYNIVSLNITRLSTQTEEELQRNKELFGSRMEIKDVLVQIRTQPDSDSAYIRMTDERTRDVIVGKNGGYSRFNNKGNRVSVKDFDAKYGKRSGL